MFLPVANLQGVQLGYVAGLRDLNRVTGQLKGVVIAPLNAGSELRPHYLGRNAQRQDDDPQPPDRHRNQRGRGRQGHRPDQSPPDKRDVKED